LLHPSGASDSSTYGKEKLTPERRRYTSPRALTQARTFHSMALGPDRGMSPVLPCVSSEAAGRVSDWDSEAKHCSLIDDD